MKTRSKPTAEDVMNSPVFSLGIDTPLREAADALTEREISGALVADRNGKPVGVVSLFDIVTHLAGLDRPPGELGGFYRYAYPAWDGEEGAERWEREIAERESPDELAVGEIMTTRILSIPSHASLERVARTMKRRRIHRIFVTRAGDLVGVISSMDLVGAFGGEPTRRRGR